MLKDISRTGTQHLLKNTKLEMSEKERLLNCCVKLSRANFHEVSTFNTVASFVATQEIIRRGKPFTDGEYIKESFIIISEHLFWDFKIKNEIVQKTERYASLCKHCQRQGH